MVELPRGNWSRWLTVFTALILLGDPGCAPKPGPGTFEIEINETPETTDDYVTWAPTVCRIRFLKNDPKVPSSLKVGLKSTGTGGRVLFADYQGSWPANTTATLTELPLTVLSDGKWARFIIAGDPKYPSTQDKDCSIQIWVQDAAGAWLYFSAKTLMVRVRKDANTLSAGERDRFLNAIRALHYNKRSGSKYAIYQAIHSIARAEAHHVAAFVAWHRIFVLEYERALQAIDPSVTVPYWNFDKAAPNVFSADFMGSNIGKLGPSDGDVFFSLGNPLNGWSIEGLAPISRATWNDHQQLDSAIYGESASLAPTTYESFRAFEGDDHGEAHVWTGGWMQILSLAVRDPLFFMLHSNVDRLWAKWQRLYDRFGVTPTDYSPIGAFPAGGTPTEHVGSYLEDTMWPWNGTTGNADPNDLSQRPAAAPGGPFLPAAPFNLGPPAQPRPLDAIDYLGRSDIAKELGFCYDDVPDNIAPETAKREALLWIESQRAMTTNAMEALIDRRRPLDDRLKAGSGLGALSDRAAQEKLLLLLADPKQDDRLRLLALTKGHLPASRSLVLALTRILSEPANGGESLKVVAMDRLRVIAEFTMLGHEMRTVILDSWRKATSSSYPSLRMRALEALAIRQDPQGLRSLAAVLSASKPSWPSKAQAIRLLSMSDGATAYFASFRSLLAKSDPETRAAAARALGKDEPSRSMLIQLAQSAAEFPEVRVAAVEALSGNDRGFLGYGLPFLADTKQEVAVRLAVVNAVAQILNREQASPEERQQIAKTLTALAGDPTPQIQRDARTALTLLASRGNAKK
jgi:tyrosinase